MSDHRLFMVSVGDKWYGYTKEMLSSVDMNEKSWVEVPDSLTSDGNQSFSKDNSTIDGKWHTIIVKDDWLDGDHQWVESKITDKRAPFYRDSNRWDGAVTERAVTSWTLSECNKSFTPTETGLATMSMKLSNLIKTIVVTDVYGDKDDPLFQTASF